MSDVAGKFSCEGCNRSYTWKPELAGKRVKCKCGHVMTVSELPPSPPVAEADALFDLAPDPEQAKPKKRVPLAPIRRSEPEREREHVSMPAHAAVAAQSSGGAAALGYQRAPTARESARAGDVVEEIGHRRPSAPRERTHADEHARDQREDDEVAVAEPEEQRRRECGDHQRELRRQDREVIEVLAGAEDLPIPVLLEVGHPVAETT